MDWWIYYYVKMLIFTIIFVGNMVDNFYEEIIVLDYDNVFRIS